MIDCPISEPCPLTTDPFALEVDMGVCPLCRKTFQAAGRHSELPPTLLELAIMDAKNRENI
ncbi:hypothetical protein ABIE64_002226 [Thalassospira sp. MBR-102]|jgi:hypothetical protein